MQNDIKNRMYLKISYSILDWGWIHDPKTFLVFIHLMLLANRKPREYMGDTIKRGEVLASYEFLAKHTGLSIQNVRTAINHLKKTNTVKHRKINNTNVFFIPSFEEHQSLGIPKDEKSTGKSQSETQAIQPISGTLNLQPDTQIPRR